MSYFFSFLLSSFDQRVSCLVMPLSTTKQQLMFRITIAITNMNRTVWEEIKSMRYWLYLRCNSRNRMVREEFPTTGNFVFWSIVLEHIVDSSVFRLWDIPRYGNISLIVLYCSKETKILHMVWTCNWIILFRRISTHSILPV